MIYAGEDTYQTFMSSIRVIYRNLVVESCLIAAVGLQIFSGIKLAKGKKRMKTYDKLHVYSGLYLSFFLTAHVFAIMAGRIYLGLDTNLYFGAATFNLPYVPWFFIPYYLLAILSFFTHVACIHRTKMLMRNPDKNYDMHAKIIILAGLLTAIVIISGMTGVKIPAEYSAPYSRFFGI
jgi:hypothetical protein